MNRFICCLLFVGLVSVPSSNASASVIIITQIKSHIEQHQTQSPPRPIVDQPIPQTVLEQWVRTMVDALQPNR